MSDARRAFAHRLVRLAHLHLDGGEAAEARPLLEEARGILRAPPGPASLDDAVTLNNLGTAYRVLGNYPLAIECVSEGFDAAQRLVGEKHGLSVQLLNNVGATLRAAGRYAEAEPPLRRALEIGRELLGDAHPTVRMCMHSLGLLYMDGRDYDRARPLLEAALESAQAPEGSFEFAVMLNAVAVNDQQRGDFAAAARRFRRVTEIYAATVGERHLNYARSLVNQAKLYTDIFWWDQAEPLWRRAAELTLATVGEQHPDYRDALAGLAVVSMRQGKPALADELLNLLADASLRSFGEMSAEYAAALHNLAMLRYSLHRDELRGALSGLMDRIRTETLEAHNPEWAKRFSALSGRYRDQDPHLATQQLLERVVEIESAVLSEGHPSHVTTLLNLARVHHEQAAYQAAEPLYRRALAIQRGIGGANHPLLATTLTGLGFLCAATGRYEEAFDVLQQANAVDDDQIGRVFTIGSQAQRLEYARGVRVGLCAFLSLVADRLAGSPSAVDAACALLLRRKALGAEAMAAQRDAIVSGRYPHLAPKLSELALLRAELAQLAMSGPAGGAAGDHENQLRDRTARRESLEAELAEQIPEMDLSRRLRNVDRKALAAALPRGAALVEFARVDASDTGGTGGRTTPRYLAFVLTAAAPERVTMLDLGDAALLDRMIAVLRASITGEEDAGHPTPEAAAGIDPGTRLRTALFDPLVPAFDGATRLFLSPDGNLSRLPFEVLPDDAGGHLVDRYEISYLSAGRDLLRLGSGRSAGTEPLVVADPDFDLALAPATVTQAIELPRRRGVRELDESGLIFDRLPETKDEGEQVARSLGIAPLLGDAALEGALKRAHGPRVLHVATHGFFLPDERSQGRPAPLVAAEEAKNLTRLFGRPLENPLLRSGLALAGANTWLAGRDELPPDAEDGILTAEDVSGLDLIGTELVVLSACETGLGEVQNGEGVFGLRRAFMLAGARTLVMSLWKVPDEQTRELMTEFYRRLTEGEEIAAALRNAQRGLKRRYADVFSWGAFVCQGDPGRLPSPC